VHLLWSTFAACPAARPCLDLNLSVCARARLVGFSQGLRPHVQRRFHVRARARARASPCLGQGLCGRRSPSSPTCVDAARPRSVRPRQGLLKHVQARLPFLPAGIVRVAAPFPRRPRAPSPAGPCICACAPCPAGPHSSRPAVSLLLWRAAAPCLLLPAGLRPRARVRASLLRAPRSPRPAVALSGDGAAAPCSASAGEPRPLCISRWTAALPRPLAFPAPVRFRSSPRLPCCGKRSKGKTRLRAPRQEKER
jgi:hypothetical protein